MVEPSALTLGRCWGEQLLETSPTGEIEYRLAEEYGASDDAKTWTFKIRKGVTFHNGKELTPADIVATLERHGDANSKSAALPFVQEFQTSRQTAIVVITLKEPNARPALCRRRLSSDDPAERRQGQSD